MYLTVSVCHNLSDCLAPGSGSACPTVGNLRTLKNAWLSCGYYGPITGVINVIFARGLALVCFLQCLFLEDRTRAAQAVHFFVVDYLKWMGNQCESLM